MPAHPSDKNKDVRWMGHSLSAAAELMPAHPSDKNKDVRWMGHSLIHPRVGNGGGRLADKNRDVARGGHPLNREGKRANRHRRTDGRALTNFDN